jgi:hypothetical protein
VGDETRQWANGKGLVMDTSFEHSTFNETDKARLLLTFCAFVHLCASASAAATHACLHVR